MNLDGGKTITTSIEDAPTIAELSYFCPIWIASADSEAGTYGLRPQDSTETKAQHHQLLT
ncbi:hypothetical protein BGZ75_004662 [Mortierella antarctica]|nr:hypothetical protein BGZ75_004662 [Mortierella antarctica]